MKFIRGRTMAKFSKKSKICILMMPFLAFMLAGCDRYEPTKTGVIKVNGVRDNLRVYFEYRDPSFDDKGPGRYTYPLMEEATAQPHLLQPSTTGAVRISPLLDQGSPNFQLDN